MYYGIFKKEPDGQKQGMREHDIIGTISLFGGNLDQDEQRSQSPLKGKYLGLARSDKRISLVVLMVFLDSEREKHWDTGSQIGMRVLIG